MATSWVQGGGDGGGGCCCCCSVGVGGGAPRLLGGRVEWSSSRFLRLVVRALVEAAAART